MSKLYIAYGSNLCKAQMRRRCPTARPLGKFMLKSARLVFRGVADLEFSPEDEVPCGLWAINPDDERFLDAYEGVDQGLYFKSNEVVLTYAGKKRRSLLYLCNSTGIYPPSQTYADTIRQGYKDFKLDETHLERAIEHAFDQKSPDEVIIARRRRQRSRNLHRELVARPGQLRGDS